MSATSFVARRETPIPSLNLTLQHYEHERTGARHYHLAADDRNNAFLVAFLTVPGDSTGVAHILEHTSLCGSRRFPVRDPFFMMIRRSLNTFMNAFTASDWTAYPFASQNRKDFGNLLEVYLDAAFFPLLDPLDFAQEGHRMEFVDPDDPASPLEYRGVVYNEMKGAMSSPISQVAQVLQSKLFPTITYHHNSGGDPADIPRLDHAALRAFHARHYHPSNAVFMTYGSFPAAEHQERIDALALSRFERQNMDLSIADERRYPSPRTERAAYATDDEHTEHKSHVLLGWLLGHSSDVEQSMRARLLAGVLLDNSASALRRALETSTLGAAPSELCGLDDSTRESTFVCGLEGCADTDADAVEALVVETLAGVARDGVAQEVVDSVVHQVELAQREIGGGGFPYGLQLMVRALGPALYGEDPLTALDIDPALERLRVEAQDAGFVPGLVRSLLLDNAHRVRLTMSPDPALGAARTRTEKEHLAQIRSALSASDREKLIEQARALEARQGQEDDPELLPKVTLDDVPPELDVPEPTSRTDCPVHTTLYTPATNGLVYVQAVSDVPELPPEAVPLLPLFCDLLADVGCGERDYLEVQHWQAAVTGGVRARTSVRSPVDNLAAPRAYFVLAGKALARNGEALTELLHETFTRARFDESERLRELLTQSRLHAESQITDAGHSLALMAASAGLSPNAALEHRWGGLGGLAILQSLDDHARKGEGLEAFASALSDLRTRLASRPREVLLVAEPEAGEALRESLERHWPAVGPGRPRGNGLASVTESFVRQTTRAAYTTSTQVSFCARAYPAPPQGHPDAPALRILGAYLRNGFLHRAIREQGGAYGAGAGYSPDSGAFRFFSYRDPRLGGTLDDFEASVSWLLDGGHPPRLLEEAILGVVGEIDRPDSPAGEAVIGYFSALHGRTPEQRRAFRKAVLEVTMDDLERVARTYLLPEAASTAVLTSVAALDAEPALSELDRHAV